jgi:uncharacterized membrane protein
LFGKNLILFSIGGISYYIVELLWRGYSHWTMVIVGGIAFILIGYINEYLSWKTPLYKQCAIATGIVLVVELLSGIVLNIILNLNVWDYSDLPFNILGQICLYYGFLWYGLSVVSIILDDIIRWKLFNEEFEGYRIF